MLQKFYTEENLLQNVCNNFAKYFLNFLQKKKRSKDCQSLILQTLLENKINQKMGTSCPNPKSICKNCEKKL